MPAICSVDLLTEIIFISRSNLNSDFFKEPPGALRLLKKVPCFTKLRFDKSTLDRFSFFDFYALNPGGDFDFFFTSPSLLSEWLESVLKLSSEGLRRSGKSFFLVVRYSANEEFGCLWISDRPRMIRPFFAELFLISGDF